MKWFIERCKWCMRISLWGEAPSVLLLRFPEDKAYLFLPDQEQWKEVQKDDLKKKLIHKTLIITLDGGFITYAPSTRKEAPSSTHDMQEPCLYAQCHKGQRSVLNVWHLEESWYAYFPEHILDVTLWAFEALGPQQKDHYHLQTHTGKYVLTLDDAGLLVDYRRLPSQRPFPKEANAIKINVSRTDAHIIQDMIKKSSKTTSTLISSYGHVRRFFWRWRRWFQGAVYGMSGLVVLGVYGCLMLTYQITHHQETLRMHLYRAEKTHPTIWQWPAENVQHVSEAGTLNQLKKTFFKLSQTTPPGGLKKLTFHINPLGAVSFEAIQE